MLRNRKSWGGPIPCFFIVPAAVICLFTSLSAQNAYLRTTIRLGTGTTAPYCIPWVDSGAKAGTAWVTTSNYITVDTNTRYQPIIAWGGTIQEKHWQAISVLSTAGKDSINRALFDTSGCNIGFLRCPIGCCDFDLNENPISLNEVANDYSMTNFSLHRDSLRKIPLIKMAQAIHPGMRFWGCPWSPPRGMHDNGQYSSGWMKTDATTMNAYALYLEKFVQGYAAAGINVEYITCQNEPEITSGGYPKCGWYNTGYINFYKNYLIPLFTRDHISTRILLGVFCVGAYADWVTTIMNDATVRSFVGVTSHSYQSPNWGPQCRAAYPNIPFFETEAPFGPYPGDGIEDWSRGMDEFNNVSDFMVCSTSVYTMWNMVNDQTAKSGWDWAQNVMIQVNSSTRQVTYNPHFYAYKHFGNYVKPGAYAIRRTVTGSGPAKSSAFRNPNGDIVLVLSNTNSSAFALTVRVGNMMWRASLPAYSMNTLRIATGTTSPVQERKLENTSIPALSNVMIRSSTLYFSLSAAAGAQEMNITLSDLQGRTLWTGHCAGSALQGAQQAIAIRPAQGNLRSGTYLLAVKIRNGAGVVTTFENRVTAVN